MAISATQDPVSRPRPSEALGLALDRARAEIRFRSIKSELDGRGWLEFSETYLERGTGYNKYFDLDSYLKRDLRRSYEIARHLRGRPSGSVIDLGSGMGYFPYCCKRVALQCLGVEPAQPECDYAQMFADSAVLLGIPTLDHLIAPFEPIPLPEDWAPIAALTANQIQFNKIGLGDDAAVVLPTERFGVEEWDYLLRDIYARSGNDSVFVHFSFNKPRTWNAPYTAEVRRYFESLGGSCRGSVVQVPELKF
jgi:hypothetical protein